MSRERAFKGTEGGGSKRRKEERGEEREFMSREREGMVEAKEMGARRERERKCKGSKRKVEIGEERNFKPEESEGEGKEEGPKRRKAKRGDTRRSKRGTGKKVPAEGRRRVGGGGGKEKRVWGNESSLSEGKERRV